MTKKQQESHKTANRKWRRNNLEKHRESDRKWRRNNPEKAAESDRNKARRWRKNNPEKFIEITRKSGSKISLIKALEIKESLTKRSGWPERITF